MASTWAVLSQAVGNATGLAPSAAEQLPWAAAWGGKEVKTEKQKAIANIALARNKQAAWTREVPAVPLEPGHALTACFFAAQKLIAGEQPDQKTATAVLKAAQEKAYPCAQDDTGTLENDLRKLNVGADQNGKGGDLKVQTFCDGEELKFYDGLPKGFKRHTDENGDVYFENAGFGVMSSTTQWEQPPSSTEKVPGVWKKEKTDEGKTYYYNEATDETRWKPPEGGTFDPSVVINTLIKQVEKKQENCYCIIDSPMRQVMVQIRIAGECVDSLLFDTCGDEVRGPAFIGFKMIDQLEDFLLGLWRADAGKKPKKGSGKRAFRFWICFMSTDRGKRMRPLPPDWTRVKNETTGDWMYVNEYTKEQVSKRPVKSMEPTVIKAWEKQAEDRWFNKITLEVAYQKTKPTRPRVLKPNQAYEMRLKVTPKKNMLGMQQAGVPPDKKVIYINLETQTAQETKPPEEIQAVQTTFYSQPMDEGHVGGVNAVYTRSPEGKLLRNVVEEASG